MAAYGPCECGCGREGELRLGRWSPTCHNRWLAHGRPESGPPPAQVPDVTKARAVSHARRDARSAATTRRVGALRDQGLSLTEIALKTGLSRRCVAKHAARAKTQKETTA